MQQNQANLSELQEIIRQFCEARDWDQFHNPKDLAISLSLEASEVLEHFQWKSAREMKEHLVDGKDEIGHELADVLYWVLLLANKANVNLTEAFDSKMVHNETKYPVEKAKGTHKKYTELN